MVGILFITLGIVSGVWSWRFLWAIPVLTFLFAVLYAFSVLMGVMFRNTIAAIMITIVFWIVCGLFGSAQQKLRPIVLMNDAKAERYEQQQLSTEQQQERDEFLKSHMRIKRVQSILTGLNYILPPTSELDEVAHTLYTGENSINVINLPMKFGETPQELSNRADKAEKFDYVVSKKRPLFTCLGFICFCLGFAGYRFSCQDF